MGNLERKELYKELAETLDRFGEILEDYEVERSDDELSEIVDSYERMQTIVTEE